MVNPPYARIASATLRRYAEALQITMPLPAADALAAMNECSVCRSYRPDPVPDDLFRLLCATALAAPTKSDLQQADILRVRAPEKRTAINALFPGSPWIAGAPEFLVSCGD